MIEIIRDQLTAAAVNLRIGLFTDDKPRLEAALDKIIRLKTALDAENEEKDAENSKKTAFF